MNRATLAIAATVATLLVGPTRVAAEPADQTIQDEAHYFELVVPGGWQVATPTPGPEEILVAYHRPETDQLLVVTRVAYPNRRAWRRRAEFFDEVVAGFTRPDAAGDSTTASPRVDRKRVFRLGRVPAMDLELTASGRSVAVRFLFFRTFSLALAVRSAESGGSRRQLRATRKLLQSFQPHFAK